MDGRGSQVPSSLIEPAAKPEGSNMYMANFRLRYFQNKSIASVTKNKTNIKTLCGLMEQSTAK